MELDECGECGGSGILGCTDITACNYNSSATCDDGSCLELDDFGINPLFFGLLVALNLQTAFLSPPVAMSAFYLKGVAPPHVTLNQIFLGMMPFMGIQVIALVLLYIFPEIGLWLPKVLYK